MGFIIFINIFFFRISLYTASRFIKAYAVVVAAAAVVREDRQNNSTFALSVVSSSAGTRLVIDSAALCTTRYKQTHAQPTTWAHHVPSMSVIIY